MGVGVNLITSQNRNGCFSHYSLYVGPHNREAPYYATASGMLPFREEEGGGKKLDCVRAVPLFLGKTCPSGSTEGGGQEEDFHCFVSPRGRELISGMPLMKGGMLQYHRTQQNVFGNFRGKYLASVYYYTIHPWFWLYTSDTFRCRIVFCCCCTKARCKNLFENDVQQGVSLYKDLRSFLTSCSPSSWPGKSGSTTCPWAGR